jgi:PKD repeat protein
MWNITCGLWGTTSKDINPIKTYVNGTYKVVLEIRNSAGASDTYER